MPEGPNLRWIEITPADVEGKAWDDTPLPFSRLPQSAESIVSSELCSLASSPTGMNFFFKSNSTRFHMRWTLAKKELGEDNFNINSFSGFDLYTFDTIDNAWRWLACPPNAQIKYPDSNVCMISKLPVKLRDCRMYLPLRNVLCKMEIGIDANAQFQLVPPRRSKQIVWYGTSIVHGAYSIRSGLGITQIMGRRLDLPTVNLGFSGGAKMEPEMAKLLVELDPVAYVIDPIHNLDPKITEKNAEPFLRILCDAKPDTPVIVLGAPAHLQANYIPSLMEEHLKKTALLEKACRTIRKNHPMLTYIRGDRFYGIDREVSFDGLHPNDLAFQRMADYLEPRFRRLLSLPDAC